MNTQQGGPGGPGGPENPGRRSFLESSAVAGAAASLTAAGVRPVPAARAGISAPYDLNEATIAELQRAMAAARLTSTALVIFYLDRNPCGSSSGSGAAPSANFTAVSIGTETDGSIVCPANVNGVVGIKPTVGLVSRAGVVPISHTQDTVGPHARTVADAAAVLSAIVSRTPDPRDPATGTSALGKAGAPGPALPADYTQFLNPDGLRSARIGVAREFEGHSPKLDAVFEDALKAMRS